MRNFSNFRLTFNYYLIKINHKKIKIYVCQLKYYCRYKHRHWNMILKQLTGKMSIGIWLNPTRCLEIWNILSSTKKKMYKDKRILRHLIAIVIFMSWHNYGGRGFDQNITASLKDAIESDTRRLLHQHKVCKSSKSETDSWEFVNFKPELIRDVGVTLVQLHSFNNQLLYLDFFLYFR